jgi:hypothetical protein
MGGRRGSPVSRIAAGGFITGQTLVVDGGTVISDGN